MQQKLELTWVGKNDPREHIEPRILIEDPSRSYGDKSTENMIIHGDNLEALKALLPQYEGRVKCIYIDINTSCKHVINDHYEAQHPIAA